MANVYIEARPKGQPEGTVVIDYVIEDQAEHLLERCRTQEEALEWARSRGPLPWSSPSGENRLALSATRLDRSRISGAMIVSISNTNGHYCGIAADSAPLPCTA